jgi:hypothetical protein
MPSNTVTASTVSDTFVGLYEAVFGTAPPSILFTAVTNVLGSANGATLVGYINQFVEGSYSKLSNGDLSTLVLNNLLGKAPVNSAALHDALTQLLNANHANRGVVITQLTDALSHLESDPTFGAAAVAWNTRVHDAGVKLMGMTTIAPLETM